jgi:uncharacterized protein
MDWLTIAYGVTCIFLAAIVRGFSGFGFSLLSITALSLVLAPQQIVPSIFMLEVAASLHLLPSIWRDIHWRSLGPLLAGCLVATPLGVYLLARVPEAPMQVALGLFVVAAALLLLRGFQLTRMPGTAATVAVGAGSGLANGAFGIGGPPVVLFYLATPAGVAAGRATLITFFLGTDVMGLGFLAREGLVTWDTAVRALTFAPPLFAGVWLGARAFTGTDPQVFRTWVLRLLMLLALLTMAKGLWAMGLFQ